jgi:Cu(I)/Ag(I) efflux system membrane fusion protein
MNAGAAVAAAAVLLAVGIGGGYWIGARHSASSHAEAQSTASAPAPERKILYYRNPMGLPDTSPVPKKDPMGMDYTPVYEGEEEAASGNQIRISTEKVQKLGVRTEEARVRALSRALRAVGTLQVDERRISTVSSKFEGWIERLHVNTTGQPVTRGQPLMEVYSPDLVTAQQEYLIAAKGIDDMKGASADLQRSMQQLKSSALTRLRNWDISDQELQELQTSGTTRRTVTLRSPVSGVVVEKPALKGMRFLPGETLYQISDLSALWVLAEVFEHDLAQVRPGQGATIEVSAFPGKIFKGKVAFLYPTITPETRTGKVRIELANPGGQLKPAMYASVELATGERRNVLTVPASAVLDSGVRQVILVQMAEGRFEPRAVKLGTRTDDYVEVLEGVNAGEAVVVGANFLIDSESNLKAAMAGFASAPGSGGASPEPGPGPGVGHRTEGTVESIDAKSGSITVSHGPVATLQWPGMTMEFLLANPALMGNVRPGSRIAFEFVERKAGEYVVTKIEPKSPAVGKR